jgi:mediator of RNA polymerase II transcription subunit 14
MAFFLYLYRHALDFRLMTEQRVAILDGSYSLFQSGYHHAPSSTLAAAAAAPPGKGKPTKAQPHPRPHPPDEGGSTLGLHPIPGFAEIILDSIRDVTSTWTAGGGGGGGGGLGKLAPVDVGVVCDVSAVRVLGRAIHDRVRVRLKE